MAQRCGGWHWYLELASLLVMGGAIITSGDCVLAQSNIIPDDTLGGERSDFIPDYGGPSIDVIKGGAQRGANLFHSFREFNVSEGRGAYFFSLSPDIQNILARVTGSNRSEILGTIGTLGNSMPNLFLINPHGIIFGPNASLDMRSVSGSGGSFVATTANAVLLGNNGIFSASEPAASNLLTVNPSALFFNNNNVSRPEIINRSTAENTVLDTVLGVSDPTITGLQVPDSRSLLLVGGNVSVDGGKLAAPGGRVELGGVAGSGTVELNVDGNNLRLNFHNEVARADISLSNGAEVNANGEGGGEIQVQGRRITLTDASIIAAQTKNQDGRGISIQASELIIQDGSRVSTLSTSTSEEGKGRGGYLIVTASDSVELSGIAPDGLPSGLFAETKGTAAAGNLTIATRQLIVQGGANVSTTSRGSTGQGGTLEVSASDFIKLSGTSASNQRPSGLFAQTLGAGKAGTLTIFTGNLIVENGAQVVAGTGDDSQGMGGNLNVTASNAVELSGTAPNGQNTTGLFARTRGTKTAGNVTVATGLLVVRDGAQVTVSGVGQGMQGT